MAFTVFDESPSFVVMEVNLISRCWALPTNVRIMIEKMLKLRFKENILKNGKLYKLENIGKNL